MIGPTTQTVLATVDKAISAIETLKAERADLVILVTYMALNDYDPRQIAYAVEKPWKHTGELAEAKAELAAQVSS